MKQVAKQASQKMATRGMATEDSTSVEPCPQEHDEGLDCNEGPGWDTRQS